MVWPVYGKRTRREHGITWTGTSGSPTPTEPKIVGADDTSIPQGTDFDLSAGVKAYDAQGNEIPFTVTPDSINVCAVGEQTFTYSADGVTKTRKITVTQILNPTISGLTELTVEVGEEFDPLEGVTAVDGNDNPVEVTVVEPTTERLLLTGGAEEFWVSASGSASHDIDTTFEYDGNYEGEFELRIKNYQYINEDTEEWTPAQDVQYKYKTASIAYSPSEISFPDIGLPNGGAYLIGDGEMIKAMTEQDYGDGYKWDSLEIWTKAGE